MTTGTRSVPSCIKLFWKHTRFLTLCWWWLIWPIQNDAKNEKWLNLLVLIWEYSTRMNTNMTGFRWFSKIFVSLCSGWKASPHWKGSLSLLMFLYIQVNPLEMMMMRLFDHICLFLCFWWMWNPLVSYYFGNSPGCSHLLKGFTTYKRPKTWLKGQP